MILVYHLANEADQSQHSIVLQLNRLAQQSVRKRFPELTANDPQNKNHQKWRRWQIGKHK
jgi:hypothetical protein